MTSPSDVILACNGTLLAFIAVQVRKISSDPIQRKLSKKRQRKS